jgi:sodium transport system permease protein
MTGAFYPAVDLCAGEKERGTLETLLSCPASRLEIVWGKLLTVMTFSMSTSLLNLISMGITGQFVVGQLQALSGSAGGGLEIGPPPVQVLGWLILILVPISALFSALSLALAAMARSSKEGQYYLMPLMFGTMPLMMLPMLPAVELDLGNSLIPVTGVILLLRSLIEGQHVVALQFALPVLGVTGICCWLSMLWATHQFQDESVLFRESERFDLKSWLIHLVRDRGPLPTVAQAFLCGALLLLARFFAAFLLPAPIDFVGFVSQTVALQVFLIAGPSLIMAWALTRSPTETLLLRLPRLSHLLVAGLLAVTLHPVASALAVAIQRLYPISEQTLQQLRPLQEVLGQASSLWQILALLALLPAICEELAFRGFVLAGLRRMNDRLLAILVSSLFFAIAHPVLQQSITAFALGLVVAFIALRTNSIVPCMFFHFVHNSLQLSAGNWAAKPADWLIGLVKVQDPGLVVYAWPIVMVGICASVALLAWLGSSSRGAKQNALYGTELSPAT